MRYRRSTIRGAAVFATRAEIPAKLIGVEGYKRCATLELFLAVCFSRSDGQPFNIHLVVG